MTPDEARNICAAYGIWRHPLPDWHAMDSDQKQRVLDAAKDRGYRAPKNRNGSTGRYFCAYLARTLDKES